ARREGPKVIVRVRDTGIGILAEMLPRIFLSFVQADRALDRSQGGLGIGLTVAKRLVEMHGGKIEAHSQGVGQGTEFVVCLPVVSEVTPLKPEEVQTEGRAHARSMHLLVVDDNSDTVQTLAMLLRGYGHVVQPENTGTSALQASFAGDWDAIILDIGLPGI